MVNLDEYKPLDTGKGYVWIKIKTNLLDDPKYMRLSDLAKVTFFEVYLLAGKSDAGGLVLASDNSATVQDLAWILRKQDADVQKALDELQRAGFVDMDGDHVTVCKFASEQGPSAYDQRRQWALRQAKRRALASGQEWHDPEQETEQNPDLDQDQKSDTDEKKEKDQDQNQEPEAESEQDKTKSKRVTRPSRVSHAGVTRDIIVEDVLTFGNAVLKVWNQLHDHEFEPVQKFWEMIQEWHDQGVTIEHARQALIQTRDQAETPMYARELAVTIRERDPKNQTQNALEKFRELYRAQKQAEQTDQADADQTGGDD